VLCAGASTHSARAQDWTYTTRAGDNLWTLAQEYLTSMQHWGRFRALNNVPFPRRMQPGTKIRFRIEWLRQRPASAVIDTTTGAVSLQLPGKAERPAKVGDTLNANARVLTADNGSAVIRFADGSNMLVRPGSTVVMDLLGVFGRSGMIDTRARLQRGRVETSVPSGSSSRNRLEIVTPSASAVVRGTDFRVSVQEDPPLTRAEVLAGRVGVGNDLGRVSIKRGTGVVTRRGVAPGKPHALLPAPEFAAVPSRLERLQLRIRWAPIKQAVGYRVQIATLGQSAVLLLDAAVDVPRANLPDLADGRYQLRIRAVDALGLEGLQTMKDFELDARPEPPVTLEPRPVQTVRVTTLTFAWTQPKIAEKFRLQIASSRDFSTLIADTQTEATMAAFELERGAYFWRIATIGPGSDQGPHLQPRMSGSSRPMIRSCCAGAPARPARLTRSSWRIRMTSRPARASRPPTSHSSASSHRRMTCISACASSMRMGIRARSVRSRRLRDQRMNRGT
jgi:hypothetical protein